MLVCQRLLWQKIRRSNVCWCSLYFKHIGPNLIFTPKEIGIAFQQAPIRILDCYSDLRTIFLTSFSSIFFHNFQIDFLGIDKILSSCKVIHSTTMKGKNCHPMKKIKVLFFLQIFSWFLYSRRPILRICDILLWDTIACGLFESKKDFKRGF